MPSYTSVPGPTNIVPRSCRLDSAKPVVGRRGGRRRGIRSVGSAAHRARGRTPRGCGGAGRCRGSRSGTRCGTRSGHAPGTMYSMRIQPVPWSTICSSRPLRSAMQLDDHALVVRRAHRWSCAPSARGPSRRRAFVTTWGLPTVSSKPSRRMISTRIASCSSPRPWTSHVSGRSVGLTLIDTLPTSSVSSRPLMTWRAVSFLPDSRPPMRRGVDADGHRDRRLVDGDERGAEPGVFGVRERLTDGDRRGMPAMAMMSPGPASTRREHALQRLRS